MDKGAHFHCCDFQVHTPRDLQWHGDRAVSEAERRDYSVRFIAACRLKGLDAVAITDHHDMAFIPYLREAASNELDEHGAAVAEEKRITVFPGMELTLAIPCQALLIFDADFPDELFNLALTALAINQAPPADARTAQIERLDINGFEALYEMLDKYTFLQGRYIVFPNVSERGTSTLLRSGHALHYKNMPCVGGYLDGKTDQLGQGNIAILGGKNLDYGNKALGLFQTSDNRKNDFSDLGTSATWVKWAEPSAEALRQACLARQSRISQTQPLTPAVALTSINVSNSAFLGPLFIEFNPQSNAIIGGRGTGKSTILEYLRWALCDAPSPVLDDEDLPEYHAKREKLVRQTLTNLRANIQVNFILNGVSHSVRRNAETDELTLKIGTRPFEPCEESDVRNLLPIQAYSQKQLSNVGVRLEELNRFIRAPIRQDLEDFDARLVDLASEIRIAYSKLHQKRLLQREIETDERELVSLNQQAESIRSSLEGLEPEEREVLSQRAEYEKEERIVTAWTEDIQLLRDAFSEVSRLTTRLRTATPDFDQLPNAEVLNRLQGHLSALVDGLNSSVQEALSSLRQTNEAGNPYFLAKQELEANHEQFKRTYELAKAKSTTHQSTITQLGQIDDRLKVLRTRLSSKTTDLSAYGAPEQDFAALREQWRVIHIQRASLIETQCETLTDVSDGQIRAILKRGADVNAISEKLKSAVSGANIRGNKIETLCELIPEEDSPISHYQLLLDELHLLALYDLDSPTGGVPSTPLLKAAGFNDGDLLKIARKLTVETWLDLCLVPLDDAPMFEYRVREDEYINFADASPGQQATALLLALLNQDGPPLIIDQPEDDLNSQVITEIVQHIWRAKQRRQLIFSSHNANLVVNGDAELVICCDYRVAGEQSGGLIKYEGAIDVEEIRNEITNVMEGGREAFKLRQEKYGF